MTVEPRDRVVQLPGPGPRLDGLRVRRLDLDPDVPALAALIAEVNRHDGVDWIPTEASLRNDFRHASGMDPSEDLIVAELDGRLVGAVEVDWRGRAGRVFHHIQPWVRPDVRRRGLGRALLAWAEAHVLAGVQAGSMGPPDRPHLLAGWAELEVPGTEAFARGAGYHVDGYGILMTRSLDEPLPDIDLPAGLVVRPVRPEDHRRIWDADIEAFRDHRDPAERTEEDFLGWFDQPDLDTSLWEVAWDRDEVAGSVMTFVFPAENEALGVRRGWLEHVSVRRPWRRQGLASALMARSMRRLRDLGLNEAALGADAENLSGAVRVYEALGFRRIRTAANYRKAIDLSALADGEAS
jgi:mycothiol synthase